MFESRITLFELLGFKIRVDASWLLLAVLVTWSLAVGFFPATYENLPAPVYWAMGVVGMLGLCLSLIFHELCHSLVARRYRIPIKGITLFVFGGVAELEDEPASAKAEFLMAIAGPLASASLAVVCYAALVAGRSLGVPAPVLGILDYLAALNAVLAGFNLLPAFPLDGGRALRAGLWSWKGDLQWATRLSSRIGAAFGMALMILGAISFMLGNVVGGMWRFLIGSFLYSAANASHQQLAVRRALEGQRVRRFMTVDPVTVPADASVQRFVDDYVQTSHHRLYPVIEQDRLVGCATVRQIKAVPRDRWSLVRVGEIMSPCARDNTVGPDEDALKALSVMQRTGNGRLMVVENGRLAGILTLKDLLDFLALKIELDRID
jgi:Zn-dependent protease/CBS domain-containing protein